jgi:hypothetical protein
MVPFVVTKNVQFETETHGFHPENQLQRLGQPAKIQEEEIIRPAVCKNILSDPTIYDPNQDLEKESTKRLTITNPPFYISLHNEFL